MKLERLKMCLDCDETFEDGDQCPVCAGTAWVWLSHWVHPVRLMRPAREQERAA